MSGQRSTWAAPLAGEVLSTASGAAWSAPEPDAEPPNSDEPRRLSTLGLLAPLVATEEPAGAATCGQRQNSAVKRRCDHNTCDRNHAAASSF